MGRLRHIQYLRGLAALCVVMAHAFDQVLASSSGKNAFLTTLPTLPNFGALGVDLFFVISGFVMMLALPAQANWQGAAHFLSLRFLRIVPLFWLITAVGLLINHANWSLLPQDALLHSLILIPWTNPTHYVFPVIAQGWTLAYEFAFYLLLASWLVLFQQRASLHTLWFWIFSVCGFTWLSQWLGWSKGVLAEGYANPIFGEFFLGMLAFQIWKKYSDHAWAGVVGLMLFLGGGFALLSGLYTGYGWISEAWTTVDQSYALERLWRWGLPSFGVVLGAILLEKSWSSWQWPQKLGLQILGDSSYSLYLVHNMILVAVTPMLSLVLGQGDLVLFTAILVAVLGGILVYYGVEKPMVRFLVGTYKKQLWSNS